MKLSLNGKVRTALSVAALATFIASAKADTVTNIDLTSFYNGNWSMQTNGANIAAAPTNGNQGTGLTFADWIGRYDQIFSGGTQTISNFAPIALNGSTTVNSLFNTFHGSPGEQTDLVFTNSLGQTAAYSLFGNETVRDYNQNVFTNELSGSNTPPNGVTAVQWFLTSNSNQRLDAQTFVLPASWNGTNLVSVEISTPASGGNGSVLSALQVDEATTAPVPEPSSLILIGTGALAMLGTLRGRFPRAWC